MKVHVEVTDTFGHEANYSWVRRYVLDMMDCLSSYAIVRRVKREIGWSGHRCITIDNSDIIELRPYGINQVCFITFQGE